MFFVVHQANASSVDFNGDFDCFDLHRCPMSTRSFISCVLLVAAFLGPAHGQSELITNGDFTNDLSDWTVASLAGSSGDWFASGVGSITPRSIVTTTSVHGAAEGTYAISDQTGPATQVLLQEFTVPDMSTSVILSFDMFVNDANSGAVVDPIGLDHTGPANQHARVDILVEDANVFDTGSDVLSNLFLTAGSPQVPNPQPFTHYEFDLTSLLSDGGTFGLRFGATSNLSTLNMGVDNVSVAVLPEVTLPPTNPPTNPGMPPTNPPTNPPSMPSVPEPHGLGVWLVPAMLIALRRKVRVVRARG